MNGNIGKTLTLGAAVRISMHPVLVAVDGGRSQRGNGHRQFVGTVEAAWTTRI